MHRVRPAALALAGTAALLAATAGRAQQAVEPVDPYTPAPSYRTFHLSAQVTGPSNRGRDILLSWGRMRAIGRQGQWMPRLELSAGVNTGHDLVDGVIAGPSVGVGYAFPSQHLSLGRQTRGEPYVVAQASTFGIARFHGEMEAERAGEEDGWGIAPAVSAGVGVRMFGDEWDVDLSTVEVVVEQRLGFGRGDPQLYIRFGRATAPRGGRSGGGGTPLAPTAVPPPPPGPL